MSAPPAKPTHIAVVMDGNGRWATRRFLPRIAGHRQGVVSLRRCVQACAERGIAVLTVFAFSSENWKRPEEEVTGLLNLLLSSVQAELPSLQSNGVQLHFVGERASLPQDLQDNLHAVEQATSQNQRLILNVCFNYGGRWDIVHAAQQLAAQGKAITEQSLSKATGLAHVPDPDLLIRTGGEQRISNFLLWQIAYTELYFSDKLWPEFDEAELDQAIAAFGKRDRRFGKVATA